MQNIHFQVNYVTVCAKNTNILKKTNILTYQVLNYNPNKVVIRKVAIKKVMI